MRIRFSFFAAAALLAVSACNLPQRVSGPLPASVVNTAAAQTVAVELTQMAGQAAATPLPLFTALPTQVTQPSLTTLPASQTPEPGTSPTTTPGIPCNRASFVTDITYPDNSAVLAGSTFIKTWRLKNNGSCTWTAAYTLVFVQGDSLGAPASMPFISGIVAPGETVDVSITLTAPTQIRTYQGFFELRDADGVNFGIGSEGTRAFWVKVTTAPLDTATPVATATTTATPAAAWQFDLLGYGPAAQWRNTADQALTWGKPTDTAPGAVFQADQILLEDGRPYDKLLALLPQNVENGTVQGLFPVYTVGSGDRFRTILGLAKTCSPGTKFHFQLKFIEEGGSEVVLLGEWNKTCDGNLVFVDQAINLLTGKKVHFLLTGYREGAPGNELLYWITPRVER